MKLLTAAAIISTCLVLTRPAGSEENFFCLGNDAVVLEYASVYDVHVAPDTNQYPNIRIQPGGFSRGRILADLQEHLVVTNYDFVLMYSLPEVPGWINSGGSYSQPLARNIGLFNNTSGQSWAPAGWPKLRSTPHMNSVEFIARPVPGTPNYGGALTVFHECFHYWGPNITHNYNVGPREWQSGNPIAWLGQVSQHWSWNFADPGMPGIMYSGPTTNWFNAFDLYMMGLMGYGEASRFSYTINEIDTGIQHQLALDDLIHALSLTGTNYYEGNGRRIPDLDPSVSDFESLIVIVKGRDEKLTQRQVDLVRTMAQDIPGAWTIATWGRSAMRSRVHRRAPDEIAGLRLRFEKAGPGFNVYWQSRADREYRLLYSEDLTSWNEAARVPGSGTVENHYHAGRGAKAGFFQLLELPRP